MLPEQKAKLVAGAKAKTVYSLCDEFRLENFSRWKLQVNTTKIILCLYNRIKLRKVEGGRWTDDKKTGQGEPQ